MLVLLHTPSTSLLVCFNDGKRCLLVCIFEPPRVSVSSTSRYREQNQETFSGLSFTKPFLFASFSSRPVKDAVQTWEMKPVMWVFEGSKDVDADTEMLISLRNEMGETLKSVDKVLCMGSSGGSHDFNRVLSELRHLHSGMKAGAPTWYSLVVYECINRQDMSCYNTTDADTTR